MNRLTRRAPVLSLLILAPALAQQTSKLQIKSFSVGPDQALTYPNNPADPGYLIDLPASTQPSFRRRPAALHT